MELYGIPWNYTEFRGIIRNSVYTEINQWKISWSSAEFRRSKVTSA
jgi:hypothetical protein